MSKDKSTTAQDDNITLFSISKQLYQLYRPHFGLKGEKLKRAIYLSGIFLGNFLLAFALVFVNTTMASLMGLLAVPGVTYTAFFWAAAKSVTAIVSYGLITGVDAWLASLLGSSLAHAVNKKLEKRWMRNNAYYGTTRLTQNPANPSQLISHDNEELARSVGELFDNYLTTVSNFAVGLLGLYTLSVPLQISFMSLSFAIPGYLVGSTIIYALVYNYVTNKIGDSLEDLQTTQRDMEAKLQTKIHHVKTHAEAIAFKKGADFEHHSLLETLKQTKVVQTGASKVRSLLSFITNLHAEFTSFFALLLCAPNIISQKLSFASILEIPYHFQNVVNFFTWKNDNFDKVTECAVTIKRIAEFNEALEKWEQKHKKGEEQLRFSKGDENTIKIKDLTLKRPDGTPILKKFNQTIPKGRITLVQGASGAGKTSLLRAMADLSPDASGEIQGLEEAHFIPSQPYFPEDKSLLDAIMYPSTAKATGYEINKIKHLMKQLGFKPETIRDLEKVKDWYGQHLSDGEKQRIEIIGAIMKQPKILVMDEATSRVDHHAKTDNKGKIERMLKEHLPKTTIIYTDHNPSNNGFCDHTIDISTKVRAKV
ncbi:MAG: ATP-binding cassette domain-containing protein [Proteobacteria bacterium]|nr:ATP-binding cassette domain-containing protein [Pseudomonadota bacterium]